VSYRYPPRVAKEKAEIIARLPKPVRDQTSSLTGQASASTKLRIAGSFMPLIYTAAAPRRRAPCGQPSIVEPWSGKRTVTRDVTRP
jgi:transposase